jgi:membrane dipeptidase
MVTIAADGEAPDATPGGRPMNDVVRPNKGFHPILDDAPPYLFVDGCMQAWPDADYANAHRHGVTAYAVTAWWPKVGFADAVRSLMYWHLVARQHERLSVATSVDEIRAAKASGSACFVIASQDGSCIEFDLSRVEAFQRLGVRMLIPAYNASNQLCGGCLDADDGGLTRFGVRVVEECDRVGVVLDCSHLGKRSSLDIVATSARPVVFSHSNVRSIVPHPRNIDDEQIRACTARGGVVGLAPFGPFTLRPGEESWPTLASFLDHVDHVCDLTGSRDHVSIGTDMSLGTYPYHAPDPWGDAAYPPGSPEYNRAVTADVRSPRRALADFNSFSHLPNLIAALGERGYDDDAIAALLGGNLLRVFGEVWGGLG